ncbi:MAG TPA: hypothetical protein VEJ20_08645 [Candidatus Eremiobacteraceae bacterium]|nr:hypothetical protein [Candidatus Eremiobacteraceae bacterium]
MRRRPIISIAASVVAMLHPIPAAASVVLAGAHFIAARAPHPMELDPSLRDPAWKLGQITPNAFWNLTKHAAASYPTTAYLLYDDENLYVAFHAEQSRVPIVATQTTNNVGFGVDDFVGVAIDTSGTGNQVYFFETTPRSVRYQQASENARYEARWESAAVASGDAWNAVLVIPLRSMRLTSGSHATWRFNFIREVAAQGEHFTWAYDGLMSDGIVGQTWPSFNDARFWPTITIDALARAGRTARARPHAEVYTLVSAGSDRDLFQQADGTFAPQAVRPAGVDVTIPLTNTINAVGTIDPDFSNVEIDQQTIVPQEFPRQLQEYRPFFTQGASFLSPDQVGFSSTTSPNNEIFYSPRIGPFDRGMKIEGSFGLQSFGLLSVRGFDETTGNTFDDLAYGYRHLLADQTFGYWADGVIAHHSIAGDDATLDVGATGLDKKTGFTWGDDQTLERGSWLPDSHAASYSNTFVAVQKPNYTVASGFSDVTPNYDPIDGLTFNSDIRGYQVYAQTTGAASWAKNDSVSFNSDRWTDESGAVHEADTIATVTATFNNGFSIDGLGPSVGILRSYGIPSGPDCTGPIVGESTYTGFPCYLDGHDERFDLFTASFGYDDGTPKPIDGSFAFGPFGANFAQITTLSTSRQLGRYSVSLTYDGTVERALGSGALDSQWLRRISVGESLGPESNVSVSLQSINGLGGFSTSTGTDIVLAFHRRFTSGDEVYVDYGTPAAASTLHRLIAKYIFHFGGDAGT